MCLLYLGRLVPSELIFAEERFYPKRVGVPVLGAVCLECRSDLPMPFVAQSWLPILGGTLIEVGLRITSPETITLLPA